MLNLETERAHLAKADRDISEGLKRVADQADLLAAIRRADPGGVPQAAKLLDTLETTLEAWRDHRRLILRTIAALENGEFGPRPNS